MGKSNCIYIYTYFVALSSTGWSIQTIIQTCYFGFGEGRVRCVSPRSPSSLSMSNPLFAHASSIVWTVGSMYFCASSHEKTERQIKMQRPACDRVGSKHFAEKLSKAKSTCDRVGLCQTRTRREINNATTRLQSRRVEALHEKRKTRVRLQSRRNVPNPNRAVTSQISAKRRVEALRGTVKPKHFAKKSKPNPPAIA